MMQIPATVSVIVPTYNVAAYTEECADSILGQTFEDIEVLVIDDGSRDGTADTWQKRANADPRVRVIRQDHCGVSIARNVGLDKANGRYLTFVDGDDTIAVDFIEMLLADAEDHGADVVTTRLIEFTDAPIYDGCDESTVLRGIEQTSQLITGRPPAWGIPAKLFRTAVFRDVRFTPGIVYEDLDIFPRLLPQLRVAVVRGDRRYGYRQRTGSIMDISRRVISADLVRVIEDGIKATETSGYPAATATHVQVALLLHAGSTIERLPGGDGWSDNVAFRRAYARFLRRNVRLVAGNREIGATYRALLLMSGLSPRVLRVASVAGHRIKRLLRSSLIRRRATEAGRS